VRCKKREEFIKALPDRLKGIAHQHPNKTLRIYFEDESRFVQQGSITKAWATKGSRPTVIRQTEF
jgi:hypothetical protein